MPCDTVLPKVDPEKRGCKTAPSPFDELKVGKPVCELPFDPFLITTHGTDMDGTVV